MASVTWLPHSKTINGSLVPTVFHTLSLAIKVQSDNLVILTAHAPPSFHHIARYRCFQEQMQANKNKTPEEGKQELG